MHSMNRVCPLAQMQVPKDIMKPKRSHSTVKTFEKMLNVEQKVLRDTFEWFCSAYLPNSRDDIDASASVIIEPCTTTVKQVTIILKCEDISSFSRFKSVIVRQKFTMSSEKNLQKATESLGTTQALSESLESIECLDCYDVEGVDITIFKPAEETEKMEKNTVFLENAIRLADHIQRFYAKNHFHWITGSNSALVLGMTKRCGKVSCIFPTHFKKFEKCTFRGKIDVEIRQQKLQIDLLDENRSLPEVTRHAKLFDRYQQLRPFCEMQQMITPNYLEGGDDWVRCETDEAYPFFSDESSDSDEEFYIVSDDNLKTTVDDHSTDMDSFLMVNSDDELVPYFSNTCPTNGGDNLDAEEIKYSSSTSEAFQPGEEENEYLKSFIETFNELRASKNEDILAKESKCSSSTSKSFQLLEEDNKYLKNIIETFNAIRASKNEDILAKESKYSSSTSKAFQPGEEESKYFSTFEMFNKLKDGLKNKDNAEGQEEVDSTSKGNESQIEGAVGENVSKNESKIEDNSNKTEIEEKSSQTEEGDCAIPSPYDSGSQSSLLNLDTREIELMHRIDDINFCYFLLAFDKEHGTNYRKCIRKKVVHKNKVVGYRITINGDYEAFIPFDRTNERTNAFLEVHKELFIKPRLNFFEKANVNMERLIRKLKFKSTKSPRSGSPKNEAGGETSRKSPDEGKKFFSFFGKKEDRRTSAQRKNLTYHDSSSDSELD